eukprot:CAMPEP_0172321050 /NCGR_PEP_ID=MMETSP1058-20130122/42092_1 /TAXON_ID=83371 /ORGANISM="Detonula confervacea, Strain CCMP 353" /LENGTH=368 /DNA_ID=CAMNT_0013036437 /DNA_START=182 /DNA_END=1285 /DNA_ORIENTATION=+
MIYSRASLTTISFIFCVMVVLDLQSAHLVDAGQLENDDDPTKINVDNSSCDANGVCNDGQKHQQTHQMQPAKDSKPCFPLPHNQQISSSIANFYHQGMSAQAYKPNAPVKSNVCQVVQVNQTNSGDGDSNIPYNVAHWSFWRSSYNDVVPLVVHGNIYSCGSSSSSPQQPLSSSNALTMEVWQPRPDGTFSSLRPGVEEGVCRASVPLVTKRINDFSNIIGQVQYETLAPGSPGIFGGLVPGSSRDYPPYGPGAIHMYLNVEGYYPILGQLDMNELENWMLQDSDDQFRFKGSDMRPHATKRRKNDDYNGIEIQSVKRVSRPGYNLAFEVKVDLFLVPDSGTEEVGNAREEKGSLSNVFCSSHGYFSW